MPCRSIICSVCAVCFGWIATTIAAQEQFDLVAPSLGAHSQATLSANQLQVISQQGIATIYARDSRFDAPGGEWMGFISASTNQVIRWPTSNRGNMQIGELLGGQVAFRTSQMSIQPVERFPNRVVERPILPPDIVSQPVSVQPSDFFGQLFLNSSAPASIAPRTLHIATYDDRRTPYFLTRNAGLELAARLNATDAADWWIAPAGVGTVRLQTYHAGRVYAVSSLAGGRAGLMPLAQDPSQLWNISAASQFTDRFILENAQYPGTCLANLGGRIALQPIGFAPTQLWVPLSSPSLSTFQPFARTVHQEIRTNPSLPPAQLELFNSHRSALVVLLGDKRAGSAVQQIRVEPNSSQMLVLDRDAGGTITETIEIRSALGIWERQQFVTAIPPAAYYDLSVYEEHLQSIAIDRTGKSPNPIEDINYVPKSVGWLPLPPGTALPSSSRIDVFPQAQAARNPGAVRRMDPKQFDKVPPQSNRLESILQEFQTQPAPRRQF